MPERSTRNATGDDVTRQSGHRRAINHLALVAVLNEAGPVRYVVMQPGWAEVALTVVDHHRRHGLGTLLMRDLASRPRQPLSRACLGQLPDQAARQLTDPGGNLLH